MMISNNYKIQLAKEAKQLDISLGQDTKFENLVRESGFFDMIIKRIIN